MKSIKVGQPLQGIKVEENKGDQKKTIQENWLKELKNPRFLRLKEDVTKSKRETRYRQKILQRVYLCEEKHCWIRRP